MQEDGTKAERSNKERGQRRRGASFGWTEKEIVLFGKKNKTNLGRREKKNRRLRIDILRVHQA